MQNLFSLDEDEDEIRDSRSEKQSKQDPERDQKDEEKEEEKKKNRLLTPEAIALEEELSKQRPAFRQFVFGISFMLIHPNILVLALTKCLGALTWGAIGVVCLSFCNSFIHSFIHSAIHSFIGQCDTR